MVGFDGLCVRPIYIEVREEEIKRRSDLGVASSKHLPVIPRKGIYLLRIFLDDVRIRLNRHPVAFSVNKILLPSDKSAKVLKVELTIHAIFF